MRIEIIIPDIDHYRYFFSDLVSNEHNVVLGKSFSLIKRLGVYTKQNKYLEKCFYEATLILLKRHCNIKKADVIAITDVADKKLPKGFIRWLKLKYPQKKYVLLLYNKISTLYGLDGNVDMTELPERDYWLPFDKIYSYDIEESKRLGFEFFVAISDVSKLIQKKNNGITHDVFYCGSVGAEWKKGRYEEADRIYNYLLNNNIDCDFHLVVNSKINIPDRPYLTKNRISYLEMERRTIKSRVILDIVSSNKNGISSRFYDALIYNKKYLTNNKEIIKHPYYNPTYMKVYEDLNDIDIEWIKQDEVVDYHYDNRYTPAGLYDLMVNTFGYNV